MNKSTAPIFFVDRSLGKRQVAAALSSVGALVEIHDDHFATDALDTEWLPEVARRNWIILTKDEKIAYRTLEQVAIAQSNARVFVLVSGNLSGLEMGQAFGKALTAMERFVEKHPSPFMAKVYKSGEVKAWKGRDQLLDYLMQQLPPQNGASK